MTVFRDFRRIADSLERLAAGQTRSVGLLEATNLLEERIAQGELGRAQFESDCEGLLMKAEGKLKAASNAEARERTMQKRLGDESDPFLAAGEEIEATVPAGDAAIGDTEEVLPLHMGVETITPKEQRLRMKFS